MANVDENPPPPPPPPQSLVGPMPNLENPNDGEPGDFSQASSSHPDDTGVSPPPPPPPPKIPLSPKEVVASEAAKISSQPLHHSDPAVWGALTALTNIARNRPQGVNMLLTSDEHCIGRLVDDMRFRVDANAASGNHCKIYRKRVAAEGAEDPSAFSIFLKDTSTNGTYLNWEKLRRTSPEAKLQHGDIISFAVPPQHVVAVAYVFREVCRFNSSNDWTYLKRKAEEFGSQNKRLKGIGVGAPEGPISRDDFQSLQQSKTEVRKQLESQVSTIDSLCVENHVAIQYHEGLISGDDFQSLQQSNTEVRKQLESQEPTLDSLCVKNHVAVQYHEGPISHDDFQSLQQSNMEVQKRLESRVLTVDSLCIENHAVIEDHESEVKKQLENQVLTIDSLCVENRADIEYHESDDTSTQGSKVGSELGMDYSSEFTTHEIFKSREALIQWVREVGRRNGFVVVIKTSDAGERQRITFGCERGGYYRDSGKNKAVNAEKKLKKAGTKKCGCPFAIKGQKLATDDDWTLFVQCGVHNHPATERLEGHSYAGRLSEEETSLLVDMSKSKVRPKEILVTLKQRDALNATTMKTIYNARHRYKATEKARRSQLQQLLGQLAEHKYMEWHRSCQSTETVTDLLWAHPVSLELLRAFPNVLIMDCTFKTNRYHLPLLEIVGVTSTDITFSVGFAYLQYEREDNYAWALGVLRSVMDESALPNVIVTDSELALMKAIDRVFPTARHLLCRGQINKNVEATCKKLFETEDRWDKFINSWNMLILSSTEGEYIKKLAAFSKDFSTYPEALEYVKNNWLDTYRERFVAAWTDTCMHCGNMTTNRAEGSHAKLKRQLGSSQGSFESSWAKIHNLLELQHNDIKSSFEKSLINQHNSKRFELNELRGNISISALDRVLAETKRANLVGCDAVACGCVIRRTYGLPCAHEIADYMREGRPIPLDAIHPHWRKLDISSMELDIDCKPELDLVAQRFNEGDSSTKVQILKKLRELANSDCLSTHNNPCAFELVASGQDSYTGVTAATKGASMQAKPKRRMKEKVYRTRSLKSMSYVDALPAGLRPYIRHVKDVAADGNCGFKAIAELMEFGEDGWLQVRRDLLTELNSHANHYKQLYGTQERVDALVHTLSYFEDSPPYDRWMIMPDMGHLISSHYNVVLYHLSSKQCLTFLPLRSAPLPTGSRKEISIGFINGDHFVQVFLLPGHPVPPVATNWHQYHHPCAQGWDAAYNTRIQHFREIVSSDVVTRETIELG